MQLQFTQQFLGSFGFVFTHIFRSNVMLWDTGLDKILSHTISGRFYYERNVQRLKIRVKRGNQDEGSEVLHSISTSGMKNKHFEQVARKDREVYYIQWPIFWEGKGWSQGVKRKWGWIKRGNKKCSLKTEGGGVPSSFLFFTQTFITLHIFDQMSWSWFQSKAFR